MFAHVFVKGATRNPLDHPNPGDSILEQSAHVRASSLSTRWQCPHNCGSCHPEGFGSQQVRCIHSHPMSVAKESMRARGILANDGINAWKYHVGARYLEQYATDAVKRTLDPAEMHEEFLVSARNRCHVHTQSI